MRNTWVAWLELMEQAMEETDPSRIMSNLKAHHRYLTWRAEKNLLGYSGNSLAKFLSLRWHAVASWTWDAQDETCGICRMAFDGCCSDCKLPGDDCPLSKSLLRVVTFGNTVMIISHIVDSLFSSLKEFLVDAMPFNSSYLSVPEHYVTRIHDLGGMQPCFSSSLHPEMGEFTDISSTLPDVPSGVAVQRMITQYIHRFAKFEFCLSFYASCEMDQQFEHLPPSSEMVVIQTL
ncbi:hypothetical protein V6N12_004518 [Hibiscus sabdariffa]|uniref:Anaphase-promoting complex subunit 11 RING-H2 finger domain-containing protein n=1 Tax=Hibiscus sabdariffa TaxID=183260 RepID=A0ABR2CM11_9ROSI